MTIEQAVSLLQERIAAAKEVEAGVVADLRIRQEYPIFLGLLQMYLRDLEQDDPDRMLEEECEAIIEAGEALERLPVSRQ